MTDGEARPTDGYGRLVGSLFSGIGGIDLGLEQAGFQTAWQVEKDEAARRVLARHWPQIEQYDDVKGLSGRELPRVDVLCGGFPCQDLSVAGRRAGLAGERSGLFHEFMRLADELAPRWVLIENVPGLLSSNDGGDMGVVLGVLADLGYGWCYRVLDAQYFGVAQRRRRVFIVGCAGDPRAAGQVLLEPESCDGDSPPSRAPREVVAALTAGGVGTCGADDNQGQAGHLIPALTTRCGNSQDDQQTGQLVPTLRASMGGGSTGHHWDGAVVADTLRSHPRPGSNSLGALAFMWQAGGDKTSSGAYETDMTPTLPRQQTIAVAYPLALRGRDDGAELEMGEEGTYNALRAGEGGASKANLVAYRKAQKAHDPDDCERWEEADAIDTLSSHSTVSGSAVTDGMAVRRLMPVECERLQGFPDNWTDGESDSARYRLLGNAVCVPVAGWIGQRMAGAHSAEHRDGIGS